MTRISFLLLLFTNVALLQAQIEIPAGDSNCSIRNNNKVSYCVDSGSYEVKWIAMKIDAIDITNKAYLPPDSEFFKNMPNDISAVWNKIETQTRMWAVEFDSVYVVTGFVKTETSKAYYKAILKGCQGDGLGFYIEEVTVGSNIKQYALTIDQVEQKTNLDFWPLLDKDLQSIFEAEFSWDFWPVLK